MNSNITFMALEDCLETILDYRGKTPQKTSSGIPLITAKIVKNGRILKPKEFIADQDYNSWMRRGLPCIGDVLLTTEAPLGEVAQLSTSKIALAQRIVGLRGKKGVLDNNYLKYALQSDYVQSGLIARATGTTVTGIKQSELRKVLIPIPELPTQRSIAHILGTLDEKIELNRKMNETLEAMAQAIFKSWFVDFDPVKAKAEGREPYGMDNETAALFPKSFEDSELGPIPKGWNISTLDKVANVIGGFAFKSKDFTDAGYPVVKIKSINSDRTVSLENSQKIPAKIVNGLDKFILSDGDIVMAMTGATIGKFGIIVNNTYNKCYLNQRVAKLSPISSYSKSYLFFLLQHFGICENVVSIGDGSAQPNISASQIASLKCITPSIELLSSFTNYASPMYSKMIANLKENYILVKLRDTLLPKLITGDMDL